MLVTSSLFFKLFTLNENLLKLTVHLNICVENLCCTRYVWCCHTGVLCVRSNRGGCGSVVPVLLSIPAAGATWGQEAICRIWPGTHKHTHIYAESIWSPFCPVAAPEHLNYTVGKVGNYCTILYASRYSDISKSPKMNPSSSIRLLAGVIFQSCLHHVCIDSSFTVEETVCTISEFVCLLYMYILTVTSEVAKLASAGSECSDVEQSDVFKVNKRGQSMTVQHLAFTCSFSGLQLHYVSPLYIGNLTNKRFLNIQKENC